MFKESDNRYERAEIREISAEAACDYVLPDYLGEVRKILFTEARCLPLPTYMNGEELSVSGAVEFRMIYTDAEGELSSVSFTQDYESCERVSGSAPAAIFAESEISSFSMRLLGPRKISAKARVGANVRLISDETLELSGSAAELPSLERATRRVEVMTSAIGDSFEREYAEPLAELDGVIAEEARVIHECSECRVLECRASVGEVWVSGEHVISAIIAVGTEPARLYEKSIPFAETLSLPAATEAMSASVSVLCPSLKIEINPTETGSTVCASLIAEYIPTATGNRPLEMVTDAYLTDRECECRYGELELPSFVSRRTVSDSAELSLGCESLSLESPESVLFVSAMPRIRGVEMADGELKITADIRISGIACEKNGDEAITYAPIRHSIEHVIALPLDTAQGNACPCVSISSIGAMGRVEDGRVIMTIPLECSLELSSVCGYRYLREIDSCGEPREKSGCPKITVYYPEEGDTLFDVARKFRTTAERVAIDKSLTEAALADGCGKSSLHGVKMLLIK